MADFKGTVRKIIFQTPNDAGAFFILLVDEGDVFGGEITVKGTSIHEISPGSKIQFSGEQGEYKGAPQIAATYISLHAEATNKGAQGWVLQAPVCGFGVKSAEKLIAAFPDDLHEALQDPERLAQQGNIKAGVAEDLVAAWLSMSIPNEILELVADDILPMKYLQKIMAHSMGGVSGALHEDPWKFATMVKGLGFKIMDEVARKLGVSMEKDSRYDAGIRFTIEEEMKNSGYTRVRKTKVINSVTRIGISDKQRIDERLDALVEAKILTYYDDVESYTMSYIAKRERDIVKDIIRLQESFVISDEQREAYKDQVAQVEAKIGITLDPSQREAAITSLCTGVSIITGGPGTGKSTTQSVILNVLRQEQEKSISMMAPTGRAAHRLGEAAGGEGKTIHRGLQYDPMSAGFVYNRFNPLAADTAIVDEFSMVDTSLAYDLLQALKSGSRFIIVGDDDQLPSVGPGQVLADFIRSEAIEVSRLKVVHRQADSSGLIPAAAAISKGEMPKFNDDDFRFIEADNAAEITAAILETLNMDFVERGLDPVKDTMVISPQRKGDLGCARLNEIIKDSVNPFREGNYRHSVEIRRRKWSVGDKVMQTRNDYDKEVMNGTVGYVVETSMPQKGKEQIFVEFEGRTVKFDGSDINDLDHAWAQTVHKMQGGEAPGIIMVVTPEHSYMLERSLIYTGVTRMKDICVNIGSRRAFEEGIKKVEGNRRLTYTSISLRKLKQLEPFLLESDVPKTSRFAPATRRPLLRRRPGLSARPSADNAPGMAN
ncbi:AAA family ATPase [Sulfitobacter sp. R18_1]|uniref:SF1B family DNA helicase RecD2 n=1 Tax=Sulfitobacter sp. R18_1 TaxID=2821104 RepID=UPI001AD9F8DA|nr:AAA family ATPase [Sulfitobacter sp. R18_1]MBO9428367.1 AAA family ATPase [Sulfitobacter sp. R18_1]